MYEKVRIGTATYLGSRRECSNSLRLLCIISQRNAVELSQVTLFIQNTRHFNTGGHYKEQNKSVEVSVRVFPYIQGHAFSSLQARMVIMHLKNVLKLYPFIL